ncbi:hypothetical protein ACJJTC_001263 [Scirpophaga incertulas]
MGNESSQLSGLEIDERAIEVTDFWSQYQAKINDSCRYFSLKSDGSVSVFKGEAALGPLWSVLTPLEKFSNNLLKYRHPCIVRYISAWQQRSTLNLVTEFVLPLSQVLKSQSPLQICIGLNNILRALVFLHEAGMSHNNVSVPAIYVTGDGQWKLGGLQYLFDSNEETNEVTSTVDQYAFAVLVEDVFAGHKDDEVPHLKEFKRYCSDSLQQENPTKRPKLSEVLQHDFFSHEFITIYKFLNFLALKCEDERSTFFSNVLGILKCYDEETIATQLSGLLLSRLTLLDETARKDVIPHILKPRNERALQNGDNMGFFSISTFKIHVKPRLIQLFGVRDSQIRMLLLSHFSKFVHVFSHEELSQHILPELLVGIKDTDDKLVASTLICLSELVPILGADTVIGGKRCKLFTDGRPNSKIDNISECNMYSTSKSLKDFACTEEVFHHDNGDSLNYDKTMILNERPTPVGGESIETEITMSTEKINKTDSEEDWSDWDNSNRQLTFVESVLPEHSLQHEQCVAHNVNNVVADTEVSLEPKVSKTIHLHKAALDAKRNMADLTELDIKNQKIGVSRNTADEFDFFADMMPVIEKPTIVNITETDKLESISSKLNFVPDDIQDSGWGDNWDE